MVHRACRSVGEANTSQTKSGRSLSPKTPGATSSMDLTWRQPRGGGPLRTSRTLAAVNQRSRGVDVGDVSPSNDVRVKTHPGAEAAEAVEPGIATVAAGPSALRDGTGDPEERRGQHHDRVGGASAGAGHRRVPCAAI